MLAAAVGLVAGLGPAASGAAVAFAVSDPLKMTQ